MFQIPFTVQLRIAIYNHSYMYKYVISSTPSLNLYYTYHTFPLWHLALINCPVHHLATYTCKRLNYTHSKCLVLFEHFSF